MSQKQPVYRKKGEDANNEEVKGYKNDSHRH